MKHRILILTALLGCLVITSCKKDKQATVENKTQPPIPLVNGLEEFSVNGQLITSVISNFSNTVNVVVPDGTDMHKLKVNFTTPENVNVTINNIKIHSGDEADLSSTATMVLTTADNKQTATYKVSTQNTLQYHGLGNLLVGSKSLNKNYDFYFDQFDGSNYAPINCGPTVTTMALRWGDSTFAKKPVDARNNIRPEGGWWFTGDITSYLTRNGLNNTTVPLNNVEGTIKQIIDNGDLAILCLDMSYVYYNDNGNQHTNKFYNTSGTGWGHFLLVKGYKQVDGMFYLEIYDPYSNHLIYNSQESAGQIRGRDRYYLSSNIKMGTDVWWPYAIAVAPKGQTVAPVLASISARLHATTKIPEASGR